MDDDSQEEPAIEKVETKKEAKKVENEGAAAEIKGRNVVKPTFADVVKSDNQTKKLTAITEKAATLDDDDVVVRRYLLAEIESAPKHLIRYSGQANLTKLMSVYSEQCSIKHCQNSPPTLNDEPSCSKILMKNEISNVDLDDLQSESTDKLSKETGAKATPQVIINGVDLQTNENDENQKQILNLMNAAQQKPFTTVIAGTAVVIPTALAASKPAESPTPPLEASEIDAMAASSVPSIGSLVCRICHNSENPERLVSPCLCKGSLSYVHIHCLERWISTSRSTVCELCQFQYKTEQTLRYTCFQSLRMWYSRSMSRRALQEDCQMFSLLTLVAFGIIGTLLVGIQYYFIQGRHWGLSSMWTKGWLLFFLFTTLMVYFINIYMIIRSQLAPWYRWWQSARDIKLILENRKPFKILHDWRASKTTRQRVITEQPTAAAAAANQNPNMPQILVTPTTPAIPPTVCAPMAPTTALAATNFATMQDKIPRELRKAKQAGSAIQAITRAAAAAAAAITDSHVPKATAAPSLPLQPYSNKLHISVELTTTAAQIIEIPLDNDEISSFELHGKSRVASTAMATASMMSMMTMKAKPKMPTMNGKLDVRAYPKVKRI